MTAQSLATPDGVTVALHHLVIESTGAALLIAHATGFHGRCYAPMAAALADRFPVMAVDFRGHGLTPMRVDEAVDWERYGDDAEVAADAASSAGPIVAFGHSMGGAALLLAAERRPELFAGLVLFEPIVMPQAVRDQTGSNSLSVGALRRRREFASIDAAFENFASKPPMNAFDPAALREYVEGGLAPVDPDDPTGPVQLRCTPEHEAATFEASVRLLLWERLADIDVPVVVIGGTTDGGEAPALIAPGIAEQLPNCRFEPHPELDHFGPLTRPAAVAEIVADAATPWR